VHHPVGGKEGVTQQTQLFFLEKPLTEKAEPETLSSSRAESGRKRQMETPLLALDETLARSDGDDDATAMAAAAAAAATTNTNF
jgi:hypothetical protein